MARERVIPVALTVAGSDSGGNAGVQADLKTFAALGVHGASVITCVTAQNPRGVRRIAPCSPDLVRRQIEAVFEELPPAAVKTGMLFSAATIRVVAGFVKGCPRLPLVVDPVMMATSGARLLAGPAQRALERDLLPRAALITPNVREAEALTGRRVGSLEDLRATARELWRRYGCAALVKGGHLRGGTEAVDVFYDGTRELLLTAPFVRGVRLHGAGCTHSAAVAGQMALGRSLERAVVLAKEYITRLITRRERVQGRTRHWASLRG